MRELTTDAAQWRDRLHQAISAGTMVDLTDGVDVDIASDTPWPDTHHIPADAIRAALLNPPTNPDPTGLRIKGVVPPESWRLSLSLDPPIELAR